MAGDNSKFNPQDILLQLSKNPADVWTVDDAMKGTSIIGGTGSGKTSASGKTIAFRFLEQGWGGLVLCAKTDEVDLWRSYCQKANRCDDLIIFGKGSKHESGQHKGSNIVFNPIDYERIRDGAGAGDTQNLTNIFMNIYHMGNSISGHGEAKEERFWDAALKRLLNRVIELLKLAGEDLSYMNIVKIVNTSASVENHALTHALSAFERGEDLNYLNLKNNYCLKCLFGAWIKYGEGEFAESIYMIEAYFSTYLPGMGDKTKGTVTESFMSLAEPFLYGILSKHFAGETNIYPEQIYGHNPNDIDDKRKRIIVLDFPIKEYLEAGVIGQAIFKLMFQQAIERRNTKQNPMPVFLWCDEAQYFLNPYDQIFLTTARSSRTATVYLSQNIPNYYSVMGTKSNAKPKVDSLMGNLSTKIFHANSDAETNEYASRLIGDAVGELENYGMQHSHFSLHFNQSEGSSQQYMPQVRPMEFTTMKSGGSRNNFEVHAIIMVSGREWSDGKNYLRKCFIQKFDQDEY